MLRPRTEPIVPSVVQPPREHIPPFAFTVGRTGALPTAQLTIRKPVRYDPMLHLRGASRVASRRAIASLTRLYREAFLDPANWRTGTYVDVWQDLAPSVKRQARRDVRVMTAGAAAGEAYLSIIPKRSTVSTTVLLDRNGGPSVVLAKVRFRALGRTAAEASNTMFESVGTFFFEHAGHGWIVVSYDVRRHDRKLGKRS